MSTTTTTTTSSDDVVQTILHEFTGGAAELLRETPQNVVARLQLCLPSGGEGYNPPVDVKNVLYYVEAALQVLECRAGETAMKRKRGRPKKQSNNTDEDEEDAAMTTTTTTKPRTTNNNPYMGNMTAVMVNATAFADKVGLTTILSVRQGNRLVLSTLTGNGKLKDVDTSTYHFSHNIMPQQIEVMHDASQRFLMVRTASGGFEVLAYQTFKKQFTCRLRCAPLVHRTLDDSDEYYMKRSRHNTTIPTTTTTTSDDDDDDTTNTLRNPNLGHRVSNPVLSQQWIDLNCSALDRDCVALASPHSIVIWKATQYDSPYQTFEYRSPTRTTKTTSNGLISRDLALTGGIASIKRVAWALDNRNVVMFVSHVALHMWDIRETRPIPILQSSDITSARTVNETFHVCRPLPNHPYEMLLLTDQYAMIMDSRINKAPIRTMKHPFTMYGFPPTEIAFTGDSHDTALLWNSNMQHNNMSLSPDTILVASLNLSRNDVGSRLYDGFASVVTSSDSSSHPTRHLNHITGLCAWSCDHEVIFHKNNNDVWDTITPKRGIRCAMFGVHQDGHEIVTSWHIPHPSFT